MPWQDGDGVIGVCAMNKLFATVTAPAPRSAPAALSTRCFVRDLVMDALIGVYAHERIKPQRIRLSLDLDVVAPGVTGEDMAAVVKGLVSQGHVTLIETLAERIAERCLSDERIASVKVRVEKLDVFPDAASVGVEIERARA
ncbi:FolB domain-containing protein [Azospirillum brasilense]|uniref:dihydroneopterin aldolase n=3 Tax=Azospirillum TaxID=191 RepID=A0A4D8Q2P3_AZOBR|nr:FolB domain-containing protein [Azospirillum argentinense]QCN97194.1 dihydroneopterin aldolase [Azospirillum argentinense]QCO04654.1 dihydroneopterin aldolase [Azospirillum argentinense]